MLAMRDVNAPMKATKQARRDATQLFRACVVNGLLDEARARRVVQQVVTAKPRGYLGTLSYFRRLVLLEVLRRTAKVDSAAPLPPDLQAKVQASLVKVYGQGVTASFALNPALIGGLRIQVGSDVYDGSVRGRLAALERSF
jgi:F-type H+-transporting ATPase subunit delta